MDLLGLTFALIAAAAMFLQGISSFTNHRGRISSGVLNLLIGVVTLFFLHFLRLGSLVIAPEFGAIMVQGEQAIWFLRVALIALAVVPALALDGVSEIRPRHLWPRIFIGIAIGTFAATRLHLLNPADAPALHVLIFDVWWPMLLVWGTVCLADALGNVSTDANRIAHYTLAAAIIAPAARFALMHQELSDPQSRPVWTFVEPAAIAIFLLSFDDAYFLRLIYRRTGRARIVLNVGFATALAVAGLLFQFSGPGTRIALDVLPLLFFFGTIPTRFLAIHLRASTAAPFRVRMRYLAAKLAETWHSQRIARLSFAAAALIFPLCFIDIFSLGVLPRDLDIAILAVFWIGFSARLAEGLFHSLPSLYRDGTLLPRITRAGQRSLSALGAARRSIGGLITAFADAKAFALTVRTVALSVLTVIVLIAVSEALNYDQQVVEPFVWKGTGADTDHIADRFSDGIVNTLGDMRHELARVVIISAANPKAPG